MDQANSTDRLRRNALGVAAVTFFVVSAAAPLTAVAGGFPIAMQTQDIGRCALGASSLGSAKEAYELALKYAIERQQFGRPIADFQAIQFKLADMAVKIYTMEQIVYDCAKKIDRGESVTLESSVVKLYCTSVYHRCQ